MEAINKNNLPLVVIFGRTNVGKSTLFNRLIESRQALVSDIPGTTRDANLATMEWRGKSFRLVDTGGIMDLGRFSRPIKKIKARANGLDEIQGQVEQRGRELLLSADLILFLVDNKAGLLPQDKQLAAALKKLPSIKPERILLVANKVDNMNQASRAAEFYRLGLGEPITVSAVTGAGTGDLLDVIVKKIPDVAKTVEKLLSVQPDAPREIRVVILGKPNVGKSSLLNSLLGEERVIVSPIPHTTREPQDIVIIYRGQPIRLMDTAGISKRGRQRIFKDKTDAKLVKFGIIKSLSRLDEADVALLVIDANEPITHQDAKIIQEISDRRSSLIIVANKWDLIKNKNTKAFTHGIYSRLPFAAWAPIRYTSALTGAKVHQIFDLLLEVNAARQISLTDDQAKRFLLQMVKIHRPSKGKGVKHPHIFEFRQIGVRPPRFSARIGSKDDLHFSYVRFIANRLREKYGFLGTPIRIEVVKNRKVHGGHK